MLAEDYVGRLFPGDKCQILIQIRLGTTEDLVLTLKEITLIKRGETLRKQLLQEQSTLARNFPGLFLRDVPI